MSRPSSYHDIEQWGSADLSEDVAITFTQLSRFSDETLGIFADYQAYSEAPRPSFGMKVQSVNGPQTLWFVGWRPGPNISVPDLVLLPSNSGGRRIPESAIQVFRARLGREGITVFPCRMPLEEVTHQVRDAVMEGTGQLIAMIR